MRVAGIILLLAVGLVRAAKLPANGDLDLARRLENAFVKVAEQSSEAVVVVTTAQPVIRGGTEQEAEHQGSGIIYRADGYIVTNNHVVDGDGPVMVRLKSGRELPAQRIAGDARTDIAVLKVEATDLPAAKCGDSDGVKVGQWAIAIGAPFDLEYSFTVGFISAKGRSAVTTKGSTAYEDYLQTDASINPGNSGGPLCDIEGRVVGMNTLIRGLNRGIGFAIPINMVRQVADGLIANGRVVRPWLGIGIDTLAENAVLQAVLPEVKAGVVVTRIAGGTPAAKSTLQPADVIVAVDAVPVATTKDLQVEVLKKRIGEPVVLKVMRAGQPVLVTVTTAEMGAETLAVPRMPVLTPVMALGLKVYSLPGAMLRQLGVKRDGAVVVAEVDEDSGASRKGMAAGDIIVEVNRQAVGSATEFAAAAAKGDAKTGVLLLVHRAGEFGYVVLTQD